jgi:hypothetical protein
MKQLVLFFLAIPLLFSCGDNEKVAPQTREKSIEYIIENPSSISPEMSIHIYYCNKDNELSGVDILNTTTTEKKWTKTLTNLRTDYALVMIKAKRKNATGENTMVKTNYTINYADFTSFNNTLESVGGVSMSIETR